MAVNTFVVQPETVAVNFAPVTELEEILQNVRTILSTVKYSVPLDREFGLSAEYLDKPIPVAEASMASDIMTTLKKYEPRVEVTGITFSGDDTGSLVPKLTIRIPSLEVNQ